MPWAEDSRRRGVEPAERARLIPAVRPTESRALGVALAGPLPQSASEDHDHGGEGLARHRLGRDVPATQALDTTMGALMTEVEARFKARR